MLVARDEVVRGRTAAVGDGYSFCDSLHSSEHSYCTPLTRRLLYNSENFSAHFLTEKVVQDPRLLTSQELDINYVIKCSSELPGTCRVIGLKVADSWEQSSQWSCECWACAAPECGLSHHRTLQQHGESLSQVGADRQ